MISIALLLLFLAFFTWQVTADDPKKPGYPRLNFIRESSTRFRIAAALVIVAAAAMLSLSAGALAGMMITLIVLMTAGCLSLVFYPFPYIRWYQVLCLFLIALGMEIYV